MPDTKITALAAIGANPINVATFPIPMVDLLDTSMAASGTTKKVTVNQILGAGGTATLASATITGDLTVDTNVLKVDSANNRVGILTASPAYPLSVAGRISYSSGIGEGADLTLSSSGATLQHGIGSSWTQQLFYLAGSEAMRLNSTGLGVGVSPSYKLDVLGSGTISGRFKTAGAINALYLEDSGTTAGSLYIGTSGDTFRIITGSNVRVNVDSSGNVGVGVTPSAWGSGFKYIQAGPGCAYGTNGSVDRTDLAANWYYNGGDKYINATGKASIFSQSAGAFSWLQTNTASGGAGSAMTLTTAMTLDASGNLLVGTSGTSWQTVAGFYYFAGSSLNVTRDGNACQLLNRLTSDGIIVDLRRSANAVGNISVTTTGATFNSTSDYRLKESVAPLSDGLARVNALKPSVYKWKSNGSDGEGFLAHELAEVVPAAVNGEKDAMNEDGTIKAQSIDMSRIVPILVAAIKELTAEVNALKNS